MKNDHSIFLLLIETATEMCSVALSRNDEILAYKEIENGYSHSKNLIPFIDDIFQQSQCNKEELNGVALSMGPGSYTGLRIGASTAKGFCYALDIPLMAISTLQNVLLGAKKDLMRNFSDEKTDLVYCPMIDARRMEVYTALFDFHGNPLEEVSAQIIEPDSFKERLEKMKVVFCGNGMPKCKELLKGYPNAVFSDAPLSATNMLEEALSKFEKQQFEDIAYFEPFYLKEYVAVKSYVKGLQ